MYNLLRKNNFFLISLGAVPASIIRWQVDDIFIINIIGCFLLGCINPLSISNKYKLILGFGFCGSLTTYSGWSLILLQSLSKGLFKLFFLNSILLLLLSCFAVFLGNFLANKIKN